MNNVFRYFVFIFILFFVSSSYSADSFLTLKQQLDRLQREVSDLSKSVFAGTQDIQSEQKKQSDASSNLNALTAFDLRIYDLEKDIKRLNEDFEELVFQIDDLKNLLDELTSSLNTKFANNQEISKLNETTTEIDINKEENNLIVNENSSGDLVVGSNTLSDYNDELVLESTDETNKNIKQSPEVEFQQAIGLIMSKQYDDAIISLKKFIDNNKENNLAGSAHYWLGEIYIFRKEYRDAAIVLLEGYQNYPNSLKAPDMLYQLSESLINIEKNKEACNMLQKLSTEYPDYKLLDKSKVKISELGCTIAVE